MSSPDITDAERAAVAAVLETPYLSMGPQIRQFEKAFEAYTGCPHAIGVSSGTAGLHLCVRAAGVGPGDLVLTTPFSFVASANVILFEGAIPIFIDAEPRSGNIDPGQLREAARDLDKGGPAARHWLPRRGAGPIGRLRAILPVDVFGQPAQMDAVQAVADDHALKVIEDSCEALGSEYKGRQAGTLGDYGVYAFYPNKQITTGEGAVIVTQDPDAARLMRALRNQGRAVGDTWLQHTHLGYNYRLDEMSAALGRVQLDRIDELLEKRGRVAGWYGARLERIPQVQTPEVMPETTRMSWFVYVVRLAHGVEQESLARRLRSAGIPVRPYFTPIHLQPYMRDRFGYEPGDFPVTEDLGRRSLALPFSSLMTERQVEQVVDALQAALAATS